MISKRQFGSDLDGQISALFNGDEQDRANAKRALLEMGSPAVERLIAILEGRSHPKDGPVYGFLEPETARHAEVHRYEHETVAASLLGELGDLRAVPALIEALAHDYSQYDLIFVVGPTAAEALTRITGVDFGTDQQAWQEWWSRTSDTV